MLESWQYSNSDIRPIVQEQASQIVAQMKRLSDIKIKMTIYSKESEKIWESVLLHEKIMIQKCKQSHISLELAKQATQLNEQRPQIADQEQSKKQLRKLKLLLQRLKVIIPNLDIVISSYKFTSNESQTVIQQTISKENHQKSLKKEVQRHIQKEQNNLLDNNIAEQEQYRVHMAFHSYKIKQKIQEHYPYQQQFPYIEFQLETDIAKIQLEIPTDFQLVQQEENQTQCDIDDRFIFL